MVKGFHLTLLIGPGIAAPVPQAVLDALESVTVTTSSDGASGFQLEFTLTNRSPLQTLFLLSAGAPVPLVRVAIIMTVNGTPEVLLDGVATNHEIRPGADAAKSRLTVTGEDLSRVMDYIDFTGTPFPGMAPETRVLLILAKYAAFGIRPLVVPSVLLDLPIPTDRIPVQKGSDLCYLRSLAAEVGYVFYLEPGPEPGQSVGYWGPEIKVGAPQKALSINFDADTNIERVSCNFQSQDRTLPVVVVHDPVTRVPTRIPVPDITPLNPPLGLFPPVPLGIERMAASAKLSPIRATAIALAQAARSAEAVTATGSLEVARYGAVLKARRLVGLRGVGTAFDGLYYVKSVTSRIRRGAFTQDFSLSRNGLVSTLSRLPA